MKLTIMRLETDPAAFFDAYHPRVYRFIASATGAGAADVDDLVQETLLHAWRSRAQYRGDASPETWILAIARNRVRMRLRADRTRGAFEAALQAIEREEIPVDVLQDAETTGAVRRALDAIDADLRDVLLRRYFRGMTVRQIANAQGETEKAVESRLHRARQALREKLTEGDDDE